VIVSPVYIGSPTPRAAPPPGETAAAASCPGRGGAGGGGPTYPPARGHGCGMAGEGKGAVR
jgi:hypothetical protein